jgi:hypothetical protein
MIAAHEIEQVRTPRGLRQFVQRRSVKISRVPNESRKAMEKKGIYKVFLDEIIPLSVFALRVYPENSRVKPVLGNQGYDALILNESGTEVDRIELAFPQDGSAKAKDARDVRRVGYSGLHIYDPGGNVAELVPRILQTCERKARNDYSDCTLVVIVDFVPPFAAHRHLYDMAIAELASRVKRIRFRAKRLFLLAVPFGCVTRLDA